MILCHFLAFVFFQIKYLLRFSTKNKKTSAAFFLLITPRIHSSPRTANSRTARNSEMRKKIKTNESWWDLITWVQDYWYCFWFFAFFYDSFVKGEKTNDVPHVFHRTEKTRWSGVVIWMKINEICTTSHQLQTGKTSVMKRRARSVIENVFKVVIK